MKINKKGKEKEEEKKMKGYFSFVDFLKDKVKNMDFSNENKEEFLSDFCNNHKDEIFERFHIDDENVIKRAIKTSLILAENGNSIC